MVKSYNEQSKLWDNIYKNDLFYTRLAVIPNSRDIYAIGGARDFDSE